MGKPAIEVQGVSKRYVIEHEARQTSLRDALHHSARKLWRRYRWGTEFEKEEFWALRDVSFSVQPGEVVGVIGRNGAGKSTLLKILSRITEPTAGSIALRGRVASLLEVGTGFHPDLTGRENIFLNGAILGMRRAEIQRKFDEIVAFAEIESFLDTPVKRYSSGMYVRLAFAVAAHLEPEILIVDEVLAVGDAQFQKKCLGRMRTLTHQEGRSILFVSHDMAAITALTSRCLLLKAGRVDFYGETARTTARYFDSGAPRSSRYEAPGTTAQPHIRRVEVRTSEPGSVQAAGKPLEVEIELSHPRPISGACVSFQIVNQYQQPATHLWIYDSEQAFARTAGGTVLRCEIPRVRLNVGNYSLKVYFSEPPGGEIFETLENVGHFEVARLGETNLWGWNSSACAYHEEGRWQVGAPAARPGNQSS
jgi:lipopolysaccharide transport system ATP-binding protein